MKRNWSVIAAILGIVAVAAMEVTSGGWTLTRGSAEREAVEKVYAALEERGISEDQIIPEPTVGRGDVMSVDIVVDGCPVTVEVDGELFAITEVRGVTPSFSVELQDSDAEMQLMRLCRDPHRTVYDG